MNNKEIILSKIAEIISQIGFLKKSNSEVKFILHTLRNNY